METNVASEPNNKRGAARRAFAVVIEIYAPIPINTPPCTGRRFTNNAPPPIKHIAPPNTAPKDFDFGKLCIFTIRRAIFLVRATR